MMAVVGRAQHQEELSEFRWELKRISARTALLIATVLVSQGWRDAIVLWKWSCRESPVDLCKTQEHA